MSSHKLSWPYPDTKQELVQVAMATLAVLMASLLFTAAKLDSFDNKVITNTNLKQAARDLSGLAMEGSLLSEQGVIRKAPENYRRAYGNKLSEQVEEIQQFLENHKIEESSQQTLETLRGQLNKLTTLFEAMSEVSDENTLKDIGKQLQSLSSDLQSLEEGL